MNDTQGLNGGVANPPERIEFDLIRNASDSIEKAITLLAYSSEMSDAARLKQAILSIAHGIELLLKERLRRIHPVLVWENVDRFPSLSARTVTVDTAVHRLVHIGGLVFSKREIDLISALRGTRNAIEHYVWTTTKEEADQIVGLGLSFALHFARKELDQNFFGYGSHRDGTLESLLDAHPQFAEAFQRNEPGDAARPTGELCEYCHTHSVQDGACRLCGHWQYDGDLYGGLRVSAAAGENDFDDDFPL